MDSTTLVKLAEFAKSGFEFFAQLKTLSDEELKNAIEKAKSSGGDTSELERVLNA